LLFDGIGATAGELLFSLVRLNKVCMIARRVIGDMSNEISFEMRLWLYEGQLSTQSR